MAHRPALRVVIGAKFLDLFFSRSQVVNKKSSNDNFFGSKKGFEWKHNYLSENFIILNKLFNDDFRARGKRNHKFRPIVYTCPLPLLSIHYTFSWIWTAAWCRTMVAHCYTCLFHQEPFSKHIHFISYVSLIKTIIPVSIALVLRKLQVATPTKSFR